MTDHEDSCPGFHRLTHCCRVTTLTQQPSNNMSTCNILISYTQRHTHTHMFNGPLSGTIWVSLYQKGKTNLDFTEARDSEWQWHQPGHMQVCISLQPDNHASSPPLSVLQAGCPSCRPKNSIKALKASLTDKHTYIHTYTRLTALFLRLPR